MQPPGFLARLSVAGRCAGSAILIRSDILITCKHVLKNAGPKTNITVEIAGRKFTCPSFQRDPNEDLALLRLPEPLDEITIPPFSDSVIRGTECQYYAFPAGQYSCGEAAIRGDHLHYLEVDLTFKRGSSGGAVVRSIKGEPHYIGMIREGEAEHSVAWNKAAIDAFLERQGVLPAGPAYLPHHDPEPYLKALRAVTRWIELHELGIDPKDTDNEPGMDLLYHPLMTILPARGKRKRELAAAPQAVLLEDALDHPRLLITGGPGSGKTTFLRRIAWALCREDPANDKLKLPFRGFPLWIRIRELDEHIIAAHQRQQGPHLLADPDWIPHFLATAPGKLPAAFFKSKLASPDTMLLIDGLDEAASSKRRAEMITMIGAAAAIYRCRWVVSTRPGVIGEAAALPSFHEVQVADWEQKQVAAFCRRWSDWLHGKGEVSDRWANSLIEQVSATDRRLRSNPMMLTSLAMIYRAKTHLPDERAKLYEAIVRWLAQKASQRSKGDGEYGIDDCLKRLGRLALEMQEWNREGQTQRAGIDDAARRIALEFRRFSTEEERFEAARKFLENAQLESGIVTLRAQKIEFWHRSFQEYLAGRRLKDLTEGDLLARAQRLLFSSMGREVLPLAAGCMSEGGSERLDWLLERLMNHAAQKPLEERAHAVGVIGAMLSDTRKSYQLDRDGKALWQGLLDEILAIFDARGKDVPFVTRLRAAEALGAARDPRLFMPWDAKYWVEVPGGVFTMGAQKTDSEDGQTYDPDADDDETPRKVKVKRFYMGRFPVTVWEYGKYLADEPVKPPENWEEQEKHPNRPVTMVDWHEAQAYCRWASRRWKVALPTEEQWEYAARGTEGRRYPWGAKEPSPERANYHETKINKPTPVGLFPQGNVPGLGISDMAGNVLEWTSSKYNTEWMVVRGASFNVSAGSLRAAYRVWFHPDYWSLILGFRCVRE